jgi:hypothetical protein
MHLVAFGKRPSLGDSCSKLLEHLFCVFPVDACVRDADTVLEAVLALLGHLLVAYVLRQLTRRGIEWTPSLPSLMLLSIMTPMMPVSPAAICSAKT